MLIAFCGLDGAGKSTQIKRINTWLKGQGRSVLVTKQPTDWYRNDPVVRTYLDTGEGRGDTTKEAELALFAASDRMRNIRLEIEPALARGDIVLCDRYVYSSYVYFECRVDAAFRRWVENLNSFVPIPDLAFFLDVTPETALARVISRDGAASKYEETRLDLLIAARQLFLSQPWKDGRLEVLDGTVEPEVLSLKIQGRIAEYEFATQENHE
ncbi:MAG: dTMP kinase [bacterium]|nr:dTMP kinase [bacterium]